MDRGSFGYIHYFIQNVIKFICCSSYKEQKMLEKLEYEWILSFINCN
jgi:hypothetical protein